jgi:hypothetical protein
MVYDDRSVDRYLFSRHDGTSWKTRNPVAEARRPHHFAGDYYKGLLTALAVSLSASLAERGHKFPRPRSFLSRHAELFSSFFQVSGRVTELIVGDRSGAGVQSHHPPARRSHRRPGGSRGALANREHPGNEPAPSNAREPASRQGDGPWRDAGRLSTLGCHWPGWAAPSPP